MFALKPYFVLGIKITVLALLLRFLNIKDFFARKCFETGVDLRSERTGEIHGTIELTTINKPRS